MSVKSDTWMPFYIADYLRKTMRLTRDQHGGYLLLLMACWDGGGRIPNDPGTLAAITKASPAEWKKLAPVLLPFFDIDGDDLTQGRVIAEHARSARLSEARRIAGAKGGRPGKQNESSNKPIGFQERSLDKTPLQEPIGSTTDIEGSNDPSHPTTTLGASTPDFTTMVAEAVSAAGGMADMTSPAIHHARDLRSFIQPLSGEPCEWGEVLDAIRMTAMRQRAKGKQIRSWTWIESDVLNLRDKRLSGGLPDVVVPMARTQTQSLTDRIGDEQAEARRRAFERMDAQNG